MKIYRQQSQQEKDHLVQRQINALRRQAREAKNKGDYRRCFEILEQARKVMERQWR